MNQATAYDTHKSFKRLVEAEIPEQQAEAIIDCLAGAQSELAAKVDIAGLEEATKADLARLEATAATKEDMAELKADIAKLEVRLTNKMYGLAIGIVASHTALTVALIKLLP